MTTFKAGDRVRHRVTGSDGVVVRRVGPEWSEIRYSDSSATYATLNSSLELVESAPPKFDEGAVVQLRGLLGEISEALGMSSFTCTEAEAIFEIYELAGMGDEAHAFMRTHAHDDSEQEDDLHQLDETNENGWSYR